MSKFGEKKEPHHKTERTTANTDEQPPSNYEVLCYRSSKEMRNIKHTSSIISIISPLAVREVPTIICLPNEYLFLKQGRFSLCLEEERRLHLLSKMSGNL